MAYDRPVRNACAHCAVLPLSDFAALAGAEAQVLDRVKLRRKLAPGEALFHQGEPYSALYCIAEGLVGRRILHESGASVLASMARPGDMLGACGLLAGGPHASTAEALTAVTVCVVPGSDASRLAEAEPALRGRLIARCVAALGAAERQVLEAAALPGLARLCGLLLEFLGPCAKVGAGAPGADRVETELPLARGDLADLLGVKPESLSRLLRRASEEGLVSVEGRRIVAPSLTRLREAAMAARKGGGA
jgi:CRP/FNR family transcriptional regulator